MFSSSAPAILYITMKCYAKGIWPHLAKFLTWWGCSREAAKRHAKCKNKYTEKQQKGEKTSHLTFCNLNFKVRFAVTFPPTSPATELTNSEFASLPRLSQLRTDSFVHLATWKVGNIMFTITKIMEQWNFCTIYWSNMIHSCFHCNYVSFLFLSVLFYFIFVLFHY